MADQFTVAVSSQRLMNRLQRLSLRVHDAQAPLAEWGQTLQAATQERWRQQVDPRGRPWKPLAPKTILRKRRLKQFPQILRATDRLRQSIRVSIQKDRLKLGTAVRYAPHVAKKRPFLGVTDADVRVGIAIMQRHIQS